MGSDTGLPLAKKALISSHLDLRDLLLVLQGPPPMLLPQRRLPEPSSGTTSSLCSVTPGPHLRDWPRARSRKGHHASNPSWAQEAGHPSQAEVSSAGLASSASHTQGQLLRLQVGHGSGALPAFPWQPSTKSLFVALTQVELVLSNFPPTKAQSWL